MSCSTITGARPTARFTTPRAQRTRMLAPVRAGNPFVGETNDPEKVKQRKDEKVSARHEPPSQQMPILVTRQSISPYALLVCMDAADVPVRC